MEKLFKRKITNRKKRPITRFGCVKIESNYKEEGRKNGQATFGNRREKLLGN